MMLLSLAVAINGAMGQVPHLPPISRQVLPKNETVMELKGTGKLSGATISIRDQRIIISYGGSPPDIIALGSRTIDDVMNELKTKFGNDISVSSNYPTYGTNDIGSLAPTSLAAVNVPASTDRPEVDIGFGVVFGLNKSTSDATNNGVLSQAGFQLDAIGNYQVLGPPSKPSARPLHYLQGRLGIASNQQLNVRTEQQSTGTPTDQQFIAALEQANQIALTGQWDIVFPFSTDPNPTLEFILSPNGGINWTQLEQFNFPTVIVRDTIRDSEQYFASQLVTQVKSRLNRTLPLNEYGALGLFQFNRDGQPLFYLGGGVVWKEIIQRTVLFTTTSVGTPNPNSLRDSLSTPSQKFWRAAFGARIAGVLDIRLDAAGPIGRRAADPLLRLIIGRGFPVTQ
jgi:hypothetical protein